MKKVLLLGGNYFQQTATIAAKELGYYVISVDYLPDNPAHKYADEYHNISTIDKEAVLALAREKQIDGIVSYASDVSAPTAAYVAEKMGLPTNPYESVMTLTHKDRFRAFMREHGFRMPRGDSFADESKALDFFKKLSKPVMVKPVDSSGSKGVTKIFTDEEFHDAYEEALSYSIIKQVIIEEFISKKGYQIDGDGFIVDGKIAFFGVMDQHHDIECSLYTPVGLSCPSKQKQKYQDEAKEQIQKIFDLLDMKMGEFNFEYIIGEDDQVYILEIGPRSGGNLIPDTIKVAREVDLASYVIKSAVGDDCSDLSERPIHSCTSSYIVHATKDGIFKKIEIDETLEEQIERQEIFVKPGDPVKKFKNAGYGIGAMIITFRNVEEMCERIDHMNDYIKVIVE
ncbi:ATP-grasp domain-containing protein [Blautia liquoris]|uniref:ATP-grasp domain-containing protein n=1 Tax=Blautia liquoris TaxID=2779518 RepID=A0A7M2RKK0_9FIRM|nr:ATP-grasp domain-containing protein [Blautia liquoris]QOV20097.1 ATP-grasp domain-containing protein [Blautia liquoris]